MLPYQVLDLSLRCEFSVRTTNLLEKYLAERGWMHTAPLEDFLDVETEATLRATPQWGETTLRELREALEELELRLNTGAPTRKRVRFIVTRVETRIETRTVECTEEALAAVSDPARAGGRILKETVKVGEWHHVEPTFGVHSGDETPATARARRNS